MALTLCSFTSNSFASNVLDIIIIVLVHMALTLCCFISDGLNKLDNTEIKPQIKLIIL